MPTALITGISGQDGSYMAELLLKLGYDVFGLVRRTPASIKYFDPSQKAIHFLYGDLRDASSLESAVRKSWPDEIYNFAAQVFVPTSWEYPAETHDVNVGGPARLLQIVEREKPDTKIYQASTSEMFGNAGEPCNEGTPFIPVSPYGVSKAAAHNLIRIYRERNIFAVGGILFNHESPRRGPEMVTRKITKAARVWFHNDRTRIKLGNIYSKRDWGFAGDYVKAIHAMMQQPTPQDYVIGTGEAHSVEEFLLETCKILREYKGDETFLQPIDEYMEIDQSLIRRNEIYSLRADSSLAQKELRWKPQTTFYSLVKMMVDAELDFSLDKT